MTVYVDQVKEYPPGTVKHYPEMKWWCHLWADEEEELSQFANKLHLKRHWFQDSKFKHYDLSARKRIQALNLGAVQMDFKDWLRNERGS